MPLSKLASLCCVLLLAVFASGCCGPLACGPLACGAAGCQSGCGECYVDPWINEPAGCDPCDSCGNYNGQSCGACRPVFGLIPSLWGYRYDGGACGGCGGCSSCDGGSCDSGACDGGHVGPHGGGDCGCQGGHPQQWHDGGHPTEWYPEAIPPGQPTPINSPVIDGQVIDGQVIEEPYTPARTKQIFRSRGPVVSRPSNSRF